MDSANMHLAALSGVKVVSIWGATHSFSGFGAWNQPNESKVEIYLDCRPCSVYGEKFCYRGDMACMNRISPEMIVEKIKSCLL
jgi:ADP-heptose:LPS heptosyltransferase